MAESDNRPGRPKLDLSEDILQVIEDHDNPAVTVGMITDEVNASRPTVKKHVEQLVDDGEIKTGKIANATAYYRPREAVLADGGFVGYHRSGDGRVSGRVGSLTFEDYPERVLKSNVYIIAGAFLVALLANVIQYATGSVLAGYVAVGAGVIALAGVAGLYALLAWDSPFLKRIGEWRLRRRQKARGEDE